MLSSGTDLEFDINMSEEEFYKKHKKPNTGLAEQLAKKQAKESNLLTNLLAEQTKNYGDVIVEQTSDDSVALPPIAIKEQKTETKKVQPLTEEQKFKTITLNEAIIMAIEENWKDNIDSLSPGKKDTVKKLLALADSIRNNKPYENTEPVEQPKHSAPLYEEVATKQYTLKEAMSFINTLQSQQKKSFVEQRESIIEQWSDTIAEALIENKKKITATTSGKIVRVD